MRCFTRHCRGECEGAFGLEARCPCTKKNRLQEPVFRTWMGAYMLLGSAVTICGKNHRITSAITIRKKYGAQTRAI